MSGGGGVLWISSDRDDQLGAKIETPQNTYSLKQNPQKSHAEFLRHENFQKALK